MSKKPNLAAIVEAAGSTRRSGVPEQSAEAASGTASDTAAPARARTRQATKQIAAHFPEEVAWQLRELAVERRTTVQALLGEGLNDLFRKYGRPELAPTETGRAA
jgi:CTP:molybdopterin cytidylyltransferase MocA